MSVIRHVRAELRRILLTVPGLPAVAWESRHFKPSADVPYIAESLDFTGNTTATLGRSGDDEERMVYALDLYWPQATGFFISDGQDMADAIRLAFHHGREIRNDAERIAGSVTNSELRPPLTHDVFTQLPVRVQFYVRRPRVMSV